MYVCPLQTIEHVLQQMILDAPPLELVYVRFKYVMEDNTVQIILMRKTVVSYYSTLIVNFYMKFKNSSVITVLLQIMSSHIQMLIKQIFLKFVTGPAKTNQVGTNYTPNHKIMHISRPTSALSIYILLKDFL